MERVIFISGTGTGVGKTVVTALLAEFLCKRGIRVAALKPVCSGGRSDARCLHKATRGVLTLGEINPWHFRAPVAPVFAARREKKNVRLKQVAAHIQIVRKNFEVVLVEGAGGLLSPLGKDFDSRDLIMALSAMPVIIGQNQLGVVNHVLLTLEALPKKIRAAAKVILMTPRKRDLSTSSNVRLLKELSGLKVYQLPWFGVDFSAATALQSLQVRRTLAAVASGA